MSKPRNANQLTKRDHALANVPLPDLKEHLRNQKKLWRDFHEIPKPRSGRPSEAPLIFLACYFASQKWRGEFTQGRVIGEVKRLLGERKQALEQPTAGEQPIVVPNDRTVLTHVRVWLQWRAGTEHRNIQNLKLSQKEALDRQPSEVRQGRFITEPFPEYVKALSSDPDFPEYEAWVADQARVTNLVRNLRSLLQNRSVKSNSRSGRKRTKG